MCTAALKGMMPDTAKDDDGWAKPRPIRSAQDIAMGDGLADAAKTSLLTRRERIRRAVEGE